MNNNPNYNQPQNYNTAGAYGANNSKVAKTMNAVIVTGEYFSQRENKKKKSYLTIGKLFIYHDGGMSLKLDAIPMQNQMISFYEIKPKSQNQQPPQQQGYNTQNPPPQQNYNNGGY
jgi:hypothetical protein